MCVYLLPWSPGAAGRNRCARCWFQTGRVLRTLQIILEVKHTGHADMLMQSHSSVQHDLTSQQNIQEIHLYYFSSHLTEKQERMRSLAPLRSPTLLRDSCTVHCGFTLEGAFRGISLCCRYLSSKLGAAENLSTSSTKPFIVGSLMGAAPR